ncbi:MAG: phage Gp37/Gp68 family protein [Lachnospiraceae bacterium]|nr:phage Gp37/Gp68 family protein [Lachnospiraceae bacterium]
MNRSKIEWCDHTFNPITGCRHDCEYCYARKMTARFAGDVRLNKSAKADYRMVEAADGGDPVYVLDKPMLNETGKPLVYPFNFEPTYHSYRFERLDALKMGNNIFVGAMADVFGEWVPDYWIEEILAECAKRSMHNYMFLTKNPGRLVKMANEGKLPSGDNFWYGSSVTNPGKPYFYGISRKYHSFISIEPILADFGGYGGLGYPEWIIIGAETGNRKGKVIPDAGWIRNIVEIADRNNIPVFMKDSLIRIVGEDEMRRDYPPELRHKAISEKMDRKLYGYCEACKAKKKKRDMVGLMAKTKRGLGAAHYCYLCRECFGKHCDRLGLNAADILATADGIGEKEEKQNEKKLQKDSRRE